MAFALAALLVACAGGDGTAAGTVAVVTPFDGPVVEAVASAFEAAHPDRSVRIVTRTDADVLAALEAGEPPAAVWWGADWHALAEAAEGGALMPVSPPWWGELTDGARDPGGLWAAPYRSPVLMVFDTREVSRGRAPSDWADLAHLRWADEVVLPPADSAVMRALVEGAMLEELRRAGVEEAGVDWLLRLDRAAADYVRDEREQVRRLAAGEAWITFLPAHRVDAALADQPWAAVRGMGGGAPALRRGIAVLRGSSRSATSDSSVAGPVAAFVEFLGSPEALRLVSEHTGWESAVRGVETDPARTPVWSLAPDTVAERSAVWMARWRAEVMGRGGAVIP